MSDRELYLRAIDRYIAEPKIEGMAKFLIPATGIMFTDKMKEILFGKEEG